MSACATTSVNCWPTSRGFPTTSALAKNPDDRFQSARDALIILDKIESTPVKDAVRQFGRDFREAVATVIYFVAWLIPWLFLILPGLVLLRMFWRWVGRSLSRFERRGKAVA